MVTQVNLISNITKPYYAEKYRLHSVDWNVQARYLNLRISLGYYDVDGITWIETKDDSLHIEGTNYDTLETMLKTVDLSITPLESLLLQSFLTIYPGTIK